MHDNAPLQASTRSAIVLIALLQGLMLHAADTGAGHWPFDGLGWRYGWNAWVLTIPTAITLSLLDLRQRILWLHAGAASLLVLALALWLAWNLQGAEGLRGGALRIPFSIALGIATFIMLPWWQVRLGTGRWRASYDALFERAWQNGLTLALAGLFTGLTWLLLWLWSALFELLQISFFRELFAEKAFISLATGLLMGFGVLIGRTQHRAIQITRQVLFAVCRGLLPLLAVITLLFVASLPFTGLDTLWSTRSATFTLLALSLLLIAFSNAVYQHDRDEPAYPRPLRWLVAASLVALPLLSGLALYALGLRINQYGWTVERFWAALAAVLVAGYAFGYAAAALARGGRWLWRLEPVNRWMCWVVLGSAVLACSPVLDPVRITLASQLARLRAEPSRIATADVLVLRFDLGRRGVDALRALQADPAVRADTRASSVVAQALKRRHRYEGSGMIDDGLRDLDQIRARLPVAAGSASPPDSWWRALQQREVQIVECMGLDDEDCVVSTRDLDGDGRDEVLLCALRSHGGPYCQVHAQATAGWWRVGSYHLAVDEGKAGAARANAALREGKLQVEPPRWPALRLDGGAPATIDHLGQEPEPTP